MLESVCTDKGLGLVYITIWLTRYTYLQCMPHMQISITFELTRALLLVRVAQAFKMVGHLQQSVRF